MNKGIENMNAEQKAQKLINDWLTLNPIDLTKVKEVREHQEAVDAMVEKLSEDYTKYSDIVNEALEYFFTECFDAKQVRTMINELRK